MGAGPGVSFFLLIDFIFHSKIERKCVSHTPHTHIPPPFTHAVSSIVDTPADGTFVTVAELTLPRHRHPESIVYIGFALGVVPSVGLDECAMTCGRYSDTVFVPWYSVMPNIFSSFRGIGIFNAFWVIAVCSQAWEPSARDFFIVAVSSECPLSDSYAKTTSVSFVHGVPHEVLLKPG